MAPLAPLRFASLHSAFDFTFFYLHLSGVFRRRRVTPDDK